MLDTLETHLLATGLVNPEQLRLAATLCAGTHESKIVALERVNGVDAVAVASAVAQISGIPLVQDDEWPDDLPLRDQLSGHFLNDNVMLPLRIDTDDSLVVAVADPDRDEALASLRLAANKPLSLRIAPYADIAAALAELSRGPAKDAAAATADETPHADLEHLDDLALEAPVIELVDRLLREAVLNRATDLHIEQRRSRVILRHRIDGLLQEAGSLDTQLGRAAVSRIKILSRLNIAEHRVPQDGQARLRINDRDYDLRVVTVPTIHGESVAIRLLAAVAEIPDLSRLGLGAHDEERLRRVLTAPNGLVVVTGPTGSGKTTTLAACLSHLNVPERKLVTIEDPVEYQIEGANQINVKPEIGITFTSTLRALLRYDPDVMMVGEIRDPETAHIAVHAALTGHLLLTTLHTNSAAGTLTRLLDMGVESYLLASSLRCAVAQRLVRRLCRHCRTPAKITLDLPPEFLKGSGYVAGQTIAGWKAAGCERCRQKGFHGRVPIFEVLAMNSDLERAVAAGHATRELNDLALQAGMTTMVQDGIEKCVSGDTTLEEVVRAMMSI